MRLSGILVGLFGFGFAAGVISQGSPYRNHQYGIVLPIPPGTLPCIPPVYEGTGADHGPQILLGTKDASLCSKSSGKRYVDVFASYNASEDTKTLHALLESACEFEVKRRCSPAPTDLKFNGLKSEAGRFDRSDGSIEIIVVAQAGRPDPDFDASVPSINYELSLKTDAAHLDQDLFVLRKLLKTIRIAPSSR
jgi:hypothetical protein